MSNPKRSAPYGRRKTPGTGNGSSLVSFQRFLRENKNLTPTYEHGVTELTVDEVALHNTPSDCWTIYKGYVYNVSPFMDYHPGGKAELLRGAGIDATELYDKYHPWVNADAVLGPLKLGPIRPTIAARSRSPSFGITSDEASELPERLQVRHSAPITLTIRVSDSSDDSPVPVYRYSELANRPVGIFELFASVGRVRVEDSVAFPTQDLTIGPALRRPSPVCTISRKMKCKYDIREEATTYTKISSSRVRYKIVR